MLELYSGTGSPPLRTSCSLPAVGRPTLLGGGFFAQAAHALLQFFAQRAGGVGIKGYEIPERLRAIATEP